MTFYFGKNKTKFEVFQWYIESIIYKYKYQLIIINNYPQILYQVRENNQKGILIKILHYYRN